MSRTISLATALFVAMPSAAVAECIPSFAGGPTIVTLTPDATFSNSQLNEAFSVQLRNDGDTSCDLRLTVGRDVGASDPDFPPYQLIGPNGTISNIGTAGDGGNRGASVPVTVPAGTEVPVRYQVRTRVGWGAESGDYIEELVFRIRDLGGQAGELRQRAELRLLIPAIARIRFSGSSGVSGAAQLELGTLSTTAPTRSPPFGIRVLSTSAYQMVLVSQHAGALQRNGGAERIPYRMRVGGRLMNLAGGSDMISRNRHTGPRGDLHRVSVVIDPDPQRRAGDYSDRVTVTVTPI